MADVHTPEQRSYNMSCIRSKWTKPERVIHNLLKGNGIRHRMHPDIDGSPDIILKDKRIAVLIHGCFWHKCPECFIKPKTRTEFWMKKVNDNVKRDRKCIRILKSAGWKVIIIWEHEIKNGFDIKSIF